MYTECIWYTIIPMNNYDICIIGGGAAGMMAAFSARTHHKNTSIVILDHTFELGRKLVISGAGRGNLTNKNIHQSTYAHFHGDTQFIETVFSQYGFSHITSFFESHGIPLYEEQKTGKGKLFPVVDNAKTVRDILVDDLQHEGIEIRTLTEVIGITYDNEKWSIQTNKGTIEARNVILACGGSTYPSLGSDGSGYTLARSVGHTITEPVPSAVSLVSKNILSHTLQGERAVMEIHISNDMPIIGDVLFTKYGVSGSAVLDMSRDISIRINRNHEEHVLLSLSFFPGKERQEVIDIIETRFKIYADRFVSRSLWGLFPVKIANAICVASTIKKETLVHMLSSEEKQQLIETMTDYKMIITGTRGWNEAEFTSGGVVTDEVDASTLGSKKAPHLYLAGELLDVDGDVGGYNLSWAWASGWVAGQCA